VFACLNSCLNSATDESSYIIEFKQIKDSLVVKQTISLSQDGTIQLALPEDFRGFSSERVYTLKDNQLTISGKNIEFSYVTNEYLSSGENYEFLYKLVSPENFLKLKIIFELDLGFVLNKEDIFPSDSTIITDGKHNSVIWERRNISEGEILAFFVIFKDIKNKNLNFSLVFTIFLIIFIASVLVYFLILKKKNKKDFERYLNESEKRIVNELKKAEINELWQKQLQLKTGFSKAKLSRVIRDLEARTIIKKIPFGNTNKILLK